MIEEQQQQFQYSCYMEVIMITCRTLWNHCNNIIFNAGVLSYDIWKHELRHTFSLIMYGAKDNLKDDMTAWLSSL
uniref:Uncharacterized protein n=1 Tax=Arundo donax TaxID=35708 RepID=A0A0A9F5I5_ARUDO